MKHFFKIVIITLLLSNCAPKETANWQLTPYPNSVTEKPGVFTFKNGINFRYTDKKVQPLIEDFKAQFSELGIRTTSDNGTIEIHLNTEITSSEEYTLHISEDTIKLTASSEKGIFYGLMTLWQGAMFSENDAIPCGEVSDAPRFEYRGFMLDESRHFFGVKKVKQILDMMAVLKLNTFHWHLTDGTGWRIEIKAYPKLTTIGGIGTNSDANAPAQFYTQDEIKDVVAYAKARFITIIPEIDMPGHATAANKAYPEFSGGGSERYPDFTFNPGKTETYSYLTTILREVATLFPSEYVHLGGDEVHFGNENWKTDTHVKALMKEQNLATLVDVEHYFMRRMADSMAVLNKKIAGWDEVIESGVSKEDLLVYWWRHDKPNSLTSALDGNYNTILCPRVPLYFDFVQKKHHKNGRKWGGKFGTLADVYNYPDALHTFTTNELKLIKGIQANLWTERFKTNAQLDFMTYPRLMALSESAWTKKDQKDSMRFNALLPKWYAYLKEQNSNYFDGEKIEPEVN